MPCLGPALPKKDGVQRHQDFRGDIDRRKTRDLLLVGTFKQRVDLFVPHDEMIMTPELGAKWDARVTTYYITAERKDLWS